MKISYSWLKDFIEIDWPSEKTAALLTDLGLEVEGIKAYESIKGGLDGVVVGRVLTLDNHPNADRLKLTTVDIGKDKPLKIVCGAPNVSKDQTVAVAVVGTVLYDEEQKPWKIKRSKIRGEESEGMICAEDELGLGQSHDGIMVLDEDIKPGTPLNEVLEVLSDDIYEIGLTPNRSDAMSHFGVARDLHAGLIQQGLNTPLNTPSVTKFRVDNHTRHIPVIVENSEKTLRYCGVTLTEIKVAESPLWLQNRLNAVGISPINNIVDATNYVMHELGQPFHAFDADRISGQKITVKTLPEGTEFTTFDGVERKLSAEDLMICDERKPICMAGVYGGLNSGITEDTSNIFLESAYFEPVTIRKSAKRHGLNTDASFRFERGIDPDLTETALKRLVLLIQDIAGGTVSSDIDDFYPKKIEGFQVFLRYAKINNLIGQNIDQNILKSILSSLQIRVNNVTESGMGLTIPPFRTDVQREVDVVEEILRVYGYNNIGFSDKLNATVAQSNKYDNHVIQNLIANQLIGQGFYEILTNSLIPEGHIRPEKYTDQYNVSLLNPLSKELSVMRQSLISGELESIAHNLNRKNEDLKFFEFGKTYHNFPQGREERRHLCLIVTGQQQRESWSSVHRNSGFFFLKGTLNALFQRLGFEITYQSFDQSSFFSEGLKIYYRKEKIGCFGVLKSNLSNKHNINCEILYADIDWDLVLNNIVKQENPKLKPTVKFPSIRRDFALLIDKEVSFEEIENIAFETESKLLKNVGLFDVYQGENLPKDKKSYAVSFTFLDEKKTLTDKKVDKVMKKLQKRFEEELKAELR